jgi:hypothetical protein
MARKVEQFHVTQAGRDKGKLFLLTEMTASKGEAWATRALLALAASNVNLPDGFASLGVAALAELGIRALSGLKWEVAAPLLAEMFECVQIIPDPKKPHVYRQLIEEDIEEIQIRMILRMEVWKLNLGFLMAALPSLNGLVSKAAGKK